MSLNATHTQVIGAPLLPLLVRMSVPNVLAGFTSVLMILTDGVVLGKIGSSAVAAAALILPLLMLLTSVAGASFTGTVAAFASQAFGAQKPEQAHAVASYAILLSIGLGVLIAVGFALGGHAVLATIASIDAVAQTAYQYGVILFAAAPVILFANTMHGLMRAQGNVKTPAQVSVLTALLHLLLALVFIFDVGGVRRFGIAVPAANFFIAFLLPCLWQVAWLRQSAYRIGLPSRQYLPVLRLLLNKGALSAVVPVVSNGTALMGAYFVSKFGPDALSAYSVGIRLEYLVVPVSFGIGLTLLTVVGMNYGANQLERARKAVWLGALLSAGLVFSLTIGVVVWPESSLRFLGLSGETLEIGKSFLRIVGLLYFFYGFGLTLFFAAQALGRPVWGVAGSVMRFAIVGLGALLVLQPGGLHKVSTMFAVMAFGLIAYGGVMVLGLKKELAKVRTA